MNHIDQETLDAAGQAPNPIQNCTYGDALRVRDFLKKSFGLESTICINFTVSGAIAAPLLPANQIEPANVMKGKYLFTLVKDYNPDNPAPVTMNCAAIAADLKRYPAYDVGVQCWNCLNGKSADEPFNPMSLDSLATIVKEVVADML